MKLCILGGGLTGLSLAKSLVKKGLSIDIFLNKKNQILIGVERLVYLMII